MCLCWRVASLLLRSGVTKKPGPFLPSFIRQNISFTGNIRSKLCVSPITLPRATLSLASFWDSSHRRDWWVNADNPGCIQPKDWLYLCCKPLNPCLGFYLQVYPLSCQSAHGGFPAELSVAVWPLMSGSAQSSLEVVVPHWCLHTAKVVLELPVLNTNRSVVVRTHPSSCVLQHPSQNLIIMLNFIPASQCLIGQKHRNSTTASRLLSVSCCSPFCSWCAGSVNQRQPKVIKTQNQRTI